MPDEVSTRRRRDSWARRLGLLQRFDQPGQGTEVNPAPGLGGGNGQAYSQMTLADTRRAEKNYVLAAAQKAELVQALDLFTLDTGLKGEVERRQGLDRR